MPVIVDMFDPKDRRPGEVARKYKALLKEFDENKEVKKEARRLLPGSCPCRMQESLPGARLHGYRRRDRQDPQQRPGKRPQIAHVVRDLAVPRMGGE